MYKVVSEIPYLFVINYGIIFAIIILICMFSFSFFTLDLSSEEASPGSEEDLEQNSVHDPAYDPVHDPVHDPVDGLIEDDDATKEK